MAIADQATSQRSPRERMTEATGFDLDLIKNAIDTLVMARLMYYDEEGSDGAFGILFPEERTPPHVKGDRVFDIKAYRRKYGEWQEPIHGARRRADETLLYHYYDANDVLLYIGITNSLPRRQASHEGRSTWMDFAVRSTMKRFPTRASAEVVEAASIRHERPLFNVEHNDHPDRVRRLVDYLIDRDRRDLLVPLISRG
ncbi:hypothetical protein [Nocardiopsis sp. NPDC058789]|uniref:hypothetical protein n=1 Tax=Nocardiopsis sp. NPDC058789 TaxID=3346634 RepID=UPI00366B6080